MSTTPKLLMTLLEAGQASKEVVVNGSLITMDALVQLTILDRDLSANPGSPAEGDVYIVKATGSGAWAGHDNAIAVYELAAWRFHTPAAGWWGYVQDEALYVTWTGAAWVPLTELVQDAVGAMVDGTLVYVDATPLLTRAALTGDVTASQGSNATTVVSSSETVAGKIELATQTETDTGTDDVRAVTPLKLATASTVVRPSATQTLTNKRLTRRVVSLADATSITPTGDTADVNTHANTQSAGTLTVNAPSGTPTDEQQLLLRIKSTNVQTYAWNSIYRGSTDLALPTASSGSSLTDRLGFIYNSADSTWDLAAVVAGY
jgi:hypothetical protein